MAVAVAVAVRDPGALETSQVRLCPVYFLSFGLKIDFPIEIT